MKYRVLGRTGLTVSEIGFGAWAIGGNAYGNSYGPTDDNESIRAMIASLQNGCNFYDTADVYGYGHSEELIGEMVSHIDRSQLIIATKVGGDFYSGRVTMNFHPDYIRYAVSRSLERLNTDYIDLYQLHNPSLAQIKDGEIFEVMQELKDAGVIRFIGITIDDAIEGIEAIKWDVVDCIQVVYNIFEHDPEADLFPYAEENNIGIIAREPLANGLLTGKYNENSYFPFGDIRHAWPTSFISHRARAAQNLRPLLSGEINSLTKLSLKFTLSDEAVSTVIPGCKTVDQTLENFSSSDLRDLNRDELEKIYALYKRRFYV
jgi:aryl-alcohol dehydrogenase-like predicted oxidoreductase